MTPLKKDNMTVLLIIRNTGQEIAETNYWDTEAGQKGLFYLSWNAGAGRLLVPDSQISQVAEMRTAELVIVSRGRWPSRNRADGIEIMFEDNSDSPYALHLTVEQCDRLLPAKDASGYFVFSAWTRSGKAAQWPGKYRVVNKIPCMAAWVADTD